MTINFGVICYGNLCTLQTKDCKESPSADMETQPKKDDHLTLDILTEFIEVLIHQVLHMRCNLSLHYMYNCCIFRWSLQTNFGSRDLYPASIFRKHRKFNMPLQMSIQVTSCLLIATTYTPRIFFKCSLEPLSSDTDITNKRKTVENAPRMTYSFSQPWVNDYIQKTLTGVREMLSRKFVY